MVYAVGTKVATTAEEFMTGQGGNIAKCIFNTEVSFPWVGPTHTGSSTGSSMDTYYELLYK